MSSYVHEHDHIDLIVSAIPTWLPPRACYMLDRRRAETERPLARTPQYADRTDLLSWMTPTDFGRVLLRANVDSVLAQYPATTDPDALREDVETYTFRQVHPHQVAPTPFPLAVLAALGSYEYQADGDPSWDGSRAQAIVRAIRIAAIEHLPGMPAATESFWSWSRRPVGARS